MVKELDGKVMDTKDLFLPEVDIKIEAVFEGLRITQNSESYIAREFKLTKDLRSFIKLCVEKGLSCIMQDGHPQQGKRNDGVGVAYIGFSRDPTEHWVCVVDDNSPLPKNIDSKLKLVTFNKIYIDILTESVKEPEEEWSNNDNIWVPYEEFEKAISACAKNVDEVERNIRA